MKKLFFFAIFGVLIFTVHAQTAQSYWNLGGNANLSGTRFLGTLDTVPLIF